MQRKLSNEEYYKRKIFLNKINSIRSHIKRNMDELKELAEMKKSIKITDYTKEDFKTSGINVSQQEIIVCKIIELEKEIYDNTTELMDVKIITRGVLNKIKDDKCRLYMFYRYYDCLDEETIKYKMNISTRTCQRLNSQGIFSIKI